MELTYRKEGDYLIPNLTLPPEEEVILGKYAHLRRRYLQEHKPVEYTLLKTSCTLNQHLSEIEQTAWERMEYLGTEMAKRQGVTEELKAADQMKWVGMVNNIRQAAEEIILKELVYA